MQIGEVAAKAAVSIQTLRYYERRGLLPAPERRTSGYRVYSDQALQRVRFIRRAQDLGFTLDEIADLLSLWADSDTSCTAVERRAGAALKRIDTKIHELTRMRGALDHYVAACRARQSLEQCPLLDVLGGE